MKILRRYHLDNSLLILAPSINTQEFHRSTTVVGVEQQHLYQGMIGLRYCTLLFGQGLTSQNDVLD